MPSRCELFALSTLLLQAIAHPAPAVPESFDDLSQNGNLEVLFSQAFAYKPSHVAHQSSVQYGGGGPDNHCGEAATKEVAMKEVEADQDVLDRQLRPSAPITTVTITTDDSGKGTGTVTVTVTDTDTVTDTISQCTATITTGDAAAGTVTETETETDTLISSITACTATTTDYTTVTTDGPTITQTVTTPGPTETKTTTVTQAAETVTLPGSTETKTETKTDTKTTTKTSTVTNNQIVTSVSTKTQTKTLEVTKTVTSDDCGETGGGTDGGGLDYGTCSDPTIKWEYGLDGRTEYSYTTNNQKDFTFGSSPTIGAPEDLVCNRLRTPCNAPQATIDRCYEAEDATANLSGQEAADVWNAMMT
ncbi:hypothetical protein N7509_007462 [Penicillium cosmopolitanum]|uniref:Ig-like domain-containing protein n=1 Tax=Penicillium cosmopolitanum TaxID=1131564 RepID=A0A9X0B8F0_9EURO|nr:uncharacterized protein N7509_007462 [Penicillium cosmopolitanum]KAJ5391972.1 hypothetical protein N7509_007462 [Penicillium cosmopolitanum]